MAILYRQIREIKFVSVIKQEIDSINLNPDTVLKPRLKVAELVTKLILELAF